MNGTDLDVFGHPFSEWVSVTRHGNGGGAAVKQEADRFTPDLLAGQARRGRPPKADALTPAERARRYRARSRGQTVEPARLSNKAQPNMPKIRRLAAHAATVTGLRPEACQAVIAALYSALPIRTMHTSPVETAGDVCEWCKARGDRGGCGWFGCGGDKRQARFVDGA